jgi:hypothetical protein
MATPVRYDAKTMRFQPPYRLVIGSKMRDRATPFNREFNPTAKFFQMPLNSTGQLLATNHAF